MANAINKCYKNIINTNVKAKDKLDYMQCGKNKGNHS